VFVHRLGMGQTVLNSVCEGRKVGVILLCYLFPGQRQLEKVRFFDEAIRSNLTLAN
jgi:hypothetical protein